MSAVASTLIPGVVRHPLTARTQRRAFVVNLEHGLHARPCALLVKTLGPFRSEVLVEANGVRVSGRSVLGLMMLAAYRGSTVTFTMTGEDAPAAMAAVAWLFATGFSGAYALPKGSQTTL